jgi:hypothetical protein
MRRALLCLSLVGTLLPAGSDQGKPDRVPDVEVVEFTALREGRRILIDGTVVARRAEPIPGLYVKVDLLDTGGKLLSERQTAVTEELLEAGEEVSFSLACADQARVAQARLDLYSARRMPLSVARAGPYPIE